MASAEWNGRHRRAALASGDDDDVDGERPAVNQEHIRRAKKRVSIFQQVDLDDSFSLLNGDDADLGFDFINTSGGDPDSLFLGPDPVNVFLGKDNESGAATGEGTDIKQAKTRFSMYVPPSPQPSAAEKTIADANVAQQPSAVQKSASDATIENADINSGIGEPIIAVVSLKMPALPPTPERVRGSVRSKRTATDDATAKALSSTVSKAATTSIAGIQSARSKAHVAIAKANSTVSKTEQPNATSDVIPDPIQVPTMAQNETRLQRADAHSIPDGHSNPTLEQKSVSSKQTLQNGCERKLSSTVAAKASNNRTSSQDLITIENTQSNSVDFSCVKDQGAEHLDQHSMTKPSTFVPSAVPISRIPVPCNGTSRLPLPRAGLRPVTAGMSGNASTFAGARSANSSLRVGAADITERSEEHLLQRVVHLESMLSSMTKTVADMKAQHAAEILELRELIAQACSQS